LGGVTWVTTTTDDFLTFKLYKPLDVAMYDPYSDGQALTATSIDNIWFQYYLAPVLFPNGWVRRTVNGGTTWEDYQIAEFLDPTGISFVDALNGFCGGSWRDSVDNGSSARIYGTSDGGETWVLNSELPGSVPYQLASHYDPTCSGPPCPDTYSFIVDNDNLHYYLFRGLTASKDIGNSSYVWGFVRDTLLYFGPEYNIDAIMCDGGSLQSVPTRDPVAGETVESMHYFVAPTSETTLIKPLKSVGGEAWGIKDATTIAKYSSGWSYVTVGTGTLTDVSFSDTTYGKAVSINGGFVEVYASDDGGTTWEVVNDDTIVYNGSGNPRVAFSSANRGVCLVPGTVIAADIWTTSNAGVTWTKVVPTPTILDVWALSSNEIWAVSSDQLLFTGDGGTSWANIAASPFSGGSYITFGTALNGWMITGSAVLRTVDGGVNWTACTYPTTTVKDVFSTGGTVCYALNTLAVYDPDLDEFTFTTSVLKTTDGITFVDISTSLVGEIGRKLWVFEGVGWYITTNTGIWFTSDSGVNWTQQVVSDISEISFVDATTGWAVGPGGNILKTINGNDWSIQSCPVGTDLNSVSAQDILNAKICGSSGVLLITSNGGTTWSQQTDFDPVDSGDICGFINIVSTTVAKATVFTNDHAGFKTTNGGVLWTKFGGNPFPAFPASLFAFAKP
jgi:photosystem II stability/assembly factor-like uncharacterized protein